VRTEGAASLLLDDIDHSVGRAVRNGRVRSGPPIVFSRTFKDSFGDGAS
jgi:hypothetical protein